ncbi:hypothetical protein MPS_4256 [Mycobacterium pseudoshottsii JCM 15466]|nr:hypothetical protein MPS_4256 [Mycobacterium pseudoshottsii JCM 15466]
MTGNREPRERVLTSEKSGLYWQLETGPSTDPTTQEVPRNPRATAIRGS